MSFKCRWNLLRLMRICVGFACCCSGVMADSEWQVLPSFRLDTHNRQSGLNSAMTKAIHRDSDGRIFVGTDSNLYVYEGLEWREVFHDKPGIRVKFLFEAQSGDLLVVCDRALLRVWLEDGRFRYEDFLVLDDPDMWFPKRLYLDAEQVLWMASERHVFRIDESEVRKIAVPSTRDYQTFLHSFFFLESDDERMFLLSHEGECFEVTDNLCRKLEWAGPAQIHSVLPVGESNFLLGSDRGVEQVLIGEQGLEAPQLKAAIPQVSDLVQLSDGQILFSTYHREVYRQTRAGSWDEVVRLSLLDGNVFRMLLDSNETIWMLMDHQVLQCSQNPVQFMATSSSTPFVSVFDRERVLFGSGKQLMLASRDGKAKPFAMLPSRVRAAIRHQAHVFVSLENGTLVQLDADSGRVRDTLQLREASSHLHMDDEGYLWCTRDNTEGVVRVRFPETLQYFGADEIPTLVSCIRSSASGELYITGVEKDCFLLRWDPMLQGFKNIGVLLDPSVDSDVFAVNDITFGANDTIYLATTMGVLEVFPEQCRWLNLGVFSEYEYLGYRFNPVDQSFWGVTYGSVLHFHMDATRQFDSFNGLSSQITNYRNLLLTDTSLWAGTHDGLAVIDFAQRNRQTARAILQDVIVNGNIRNEMPDRMGDSGNLTIQCKSPNLPPHTIEYGFELIRKGQAEPVHQLSNHSGLYSPERLAPGAYQLRVRCKQQGNYEWSEVTTFEFSVYSVRLRDFLWTVAVVLLCGAGIAAFFWRKQRVSRIQIDLLNRKVEERTMHLSAKNDELIGANRVKDKLFSIISHDLRGSVGSLSQLLEIMEDSTTSPMESTWVECLRLAQNEAKSTFVLLENLLTWAKSQLGAIAPQPELLQFDEVLESMEQQFEARLTQKGIHFSPRLEANSVWADRNCLETIVRNLLSNAVKFCNAADRITVGSRTQGDQVEVYVMDTGPGIPEAALRKIREANQFFTTRGTQGENGNGLGLAVCRELLELMGSELIIESHEGSGSCFRFLLPRSH